KRLILINLAGGGTLVETTSSLLRQYPPFFSVLKALTPDGYLFVEYNRVPFWEDRFYQGDALVAISCFTSNCADAYKIAKEFRRCGATVIMGGPHVTFFPEEALEFCDTVVAGAAESVWEEVIRDYENKSLKRVYQGVCSTEGMSRVHRHLMNGPMDAAADFIQASRGCKFNCYFCATRALLDGVQVENPVEDTIALINRISVSKKNILFLDNNIYADPAYAKKLFTALIPLKLNWGASTSIDIAQDDEALALLKKSGCKMLLIGYEIDAASAEKEKGGKLVLAAKYAVLSRKIQKAGILIKAHFIFGFSRDAWGSLLRLWWACFKISPFIAGLSFLTPVPGSAFFNDSFREQKVINLNWRNYDLCAQVFAHPRLGTPWVLRCAFLPVALIFFLTASTLGRLIVLFVLVRAVFFH
ncbi:MAG: cobalamin-dependent protein, partial [Candidatus Omnitrophica bacterium]|nr:cobalamin-dependent protein [Candidatus Omnitrophota bacterium]